MVQCACGASNPEGANYCLRCGRALGSESRSDSGQAELVAPSQPEQLSGGGVGTSTVSTPQAAASGPEFGQGPGVAHPPEVPVLGQQPAVQALRPARESTGTTGVAALILGVLGLPAACIPIVGLPVNVIAIVQGVRAIREGAVGYGVAGLVLGIVGLVLTVINAAFGFMMAMNRMRHL